MLGSRRSPGKPRPGLLAPSPGRAGPPPFLQGHPRLFVAHTSPGLEGSVCPSYDRSDPGVVSTRHLLCRALWTQQCRGKGLLSWSCPSVGRPLSHGVRMLGVGASSLSSLWLLFRPQAQLHSKIEGRSLLLSLSPVPQSHSVACLPLSTANSVLGACEAHPTPADVRGSPGAPVFTAPASAGVMHP